MAWEFYSRLQKILTGENITPLSATEAAVKYAVDNAGSGGGGGGGDVVVHFELQEETVVSDTTPEQIVAYDEAGKFVRAKIDTGEGGVIDLLPVAIGMEDNDPAVIFANCFLTSEDDYGDANSNDGDVIRSFLVGWDTDHEEWMFEYHDEAIGGGEGGDTVIMDVSMGGAGGIEADYTGPEVWEIYSGTPKKEIVARVDRNGDYADIPLFLAGKNDNNYTIIFMNAYPEIDGSNVALGAWGLSWDNTNQQWEYVEPRVSIPSLPTVTQSDNGKVFRVKNGEWAASAPYKIVLEDEGGGAIGTSQSYSDILAAIKAKQGILIAYNDAELTPTMMYMEPDGGAGGPGDDFKIQCVSIDYQSSTMTVFTIETIDNGGQKDLLCSNFDYTLTPSI